MAGETKASQSVTREEESTFFAAVAYALAGVRVFPTYWPDPDQAGMCGCGNPECSNPGKHPLTEHGHKDATTDLDQVFDWWAQHPNANVAARPAEDEFVLDVDPRHGGLESLKELEGQFGPFETRTHRTGSGGFHYWFKTATPVRSRTGLLPGIDIKAASGYVLMPPSLHVQGKYEVVDGREPAMAPEGLTQLIGDARESRSLAGLTPEQLIQFSAPGETPEERLRWTRSALDMIPNNQDYNDRNRWIGMAHAIRASCGEDLEQEASELFDEFSKRWETNRYDPHKTRRAWESLRSSDDPGGFDRLLRRALDHGYVMPSDHPYRKEQSQVGLRGQRRLIPWIALSRVFAPRHDPLYQT